MSALGFSGPNLAVVAYAEVDGTAGASTATNSGVTTTRTALGTYVVVLPTNSVQPQARDLIFVQPLGTNPRSWAVDDTLDATKTITIANDLTTKVDNSFTILILRTTITPPSGAPA